ncbi:MAG: caspase family protein [Leptolyngbyaceae cyanobacterium bins.349]|nr:caspase family protein [Leptolyngbyaceae cyanobacterium bins.349]
MMRQWAILVGLNNYQMFQPLNCAQQDAQALQQFLIHEAGFAPEQCLLLTDTSPPISGRSTTPTRANLQSWIELLTHQCFKPGDTLWFFFSGYGVCSKGRDYLVPLDGDPFAVETTCILMSDIFSRIQASLSPGLPLVLLDINRSQGTFSSENVGMQTVHLAKQLAVPTILSCRPGQFSREISSLGHGLFTIVLQEALQYHQAATPETLMRFVSDRLTELGAYYFLPNQQPLSCCPADKVHQPLLQAHFASQWNDSGSHNGNGTHTSPPLDERSAQFTAAPPAAGVGIIDHHDHPAIATPSSSASNTSPPTQAKRQNHELSGPNGLVSQNLPNGQLAPMASSAALPSYPPPHHNAPLGAAVPPLDAPSQTRLPPQPSTSAVAVSERDPVSPPAMASPETDDNAPQAPLWRPILLWGGLLSAVLIGCVIWRNWSALLAPAPVNGSSNAVNAPSPSAPQPGTQPSIQPTSAEIVPPSGNPAGETAPSPTSPPERVLDFNPAAAPVAMSGQAILETARKRVMSDQATPYREAIEAARQIQTTDPAYVTAQQDIAAWSQRIWEIAQQRATQKQWDIAIMAAALVPEDDRKLHPQAQAAIAEWCPAIPAAPPQEFSMVKAREICNQKPI